MLKAGINPILAASAGFSADSVGSGATASIGQADSYMGNTFAEQNSASTASSQSDGSSWQNSENGLATMLNAMGSAVKEIASSITSSKAATNIINNIEAAGTTNIKEVTEELKNILKGQENEWNKSQTGNKNAQKNKGKTSGNVTWGITAHGGMVK